MAERREVVGCGKCGRVVWEDDVNRAGNCVLCSPPRGESRQDDDDDESQGPGGVSTAETVPEQAKKEPDKA
jgi:hypothetical protein